MTSTTDFEIDKCSFDLRIHHSYSLPPCQSDFWLLGRRTRLSSGQVFRQVIRINPDSEVGISQGRFLLFIFNVLNFENRISLKFHFVPRLRRSFSNPSLFPASRPGLLSNGPSDLIKLRREAPIGNRPERKLGRDRTKELSAEGAALANESNFGILDNW